MAGSGSPLVIQALSTIPVEFDPATLPECITVAPRKEHKATLFFLHGLGNNGENLSKFLSSFSSFKNHPSMDHVKIVFPSASVAVISASPGCIMNTWFDVHSFDTINRTEDKPSLSLASNHINALIQHERVSGIPSERIIVGGFSQGGALSCLTALTSLQPIGGLFILSSYVPLRKGIKEILGPHTKSLPIFWAHGTNDPQVPHADWKSVAKELAIDIGTPFISAQGNRNQIRLSKEEVEREGLVGLRFLSYPDVGHRISEETLMDLNVWIRSVLERAGVEN